MATEFRTVNRYGQHGMLDLERSIHADGAEWRNWQLVAGALPAVVAMARCDWGNGIISKEECDRLVAAFCREVKLRRAKKVA